MNFCDILPSRSVVFGHRLRAHQEPHSQIAPEPNRGLRPALLLHLHLHLRTHFGHVYTRGWTRSYEAALQLQNMH